MSLLWWENLLHSRCGIEAVSSTRCKRSLASHWTIPCAFPLCCSCWYGQHRGFYLRKNAVIYIYGTETMCLVWSLTHCLEHEALCFGAVFWKLEARIIFLNDLWVFWGGLECLKFNGFGVDLIKIIIEKMRKKPPNDVANSSCTDQCPQPSSLPPFTSTNRVIHKQQALSPWETEYKTGREQTLPLGSEMPAKKRKN